MKEAGRGGAGPYGKFGKSFVSGRTVRLPSGKTIRKRVLERPDFAKIMPVLLDGRIVMIREFRAAAGRNILTFPGGKIEPGENPAQAARRELEEETGFSAGSIRPLGPPIFNAPALITARGHPFLAWNLKPGRRSPDMDEAGSKVVILSEAEFVRKARGGEICDSSTLVLFFRRKDGY